MDLRNYLRIYFYVARSGRGWKLLEAEIERAGDSPWGTFVDQPTSLDQLSWWKHHADFSQENVLPRIGIPVLASWGTEDLVVPPDANAARLESLLRSGGNSDVTIQLIEGGDHRFERPMGRDTQGRWRWPRIAPEYLDSIERWVRERTGGA